VLFGPGSGDEHPGSYFRGLRNNFLGLKILEFFDADQDSGIFLTLDPGWKKILIRDPVKKKHSGSASLQLTTLHTVMFGTGTHNKPVPLHCSCPPTSSSLQFLN
jgi:hypothetical protein